MTNASHHKRIYPQNSFTMSLALQLKNRSSHHYELLRKSTSFLLLPGKRVFSEYNKKNVISSDCIFQSKDTSPHAMVLRTIFQAMCDMCEHNAGIEQMKIFALHLDEINIQSRHLFRSNTCAFGLSHNVQEILAKNMQVF